MVIFGQSRSLWCEISGINQIVKEVVPGDRITPNNVESIPAEKKVVGYARFSGELKKGTKRLKFVGKIVAFLKLIVKYPK